MNRLGQHFLKSKSAIKKIIDALEPKSGDTLIEIGAGHGELTEVLGCRLKVIRGLKIISIEKDAILADGLHKKFAHGQIEIIEGDAIKLFPQIVKSRNLKTKTYKLVGNIPYYITGKLLRILSELDNKPEICVLTIQKEVALRIAAKPPQMNRLSAIVQLWAEPEIVSVISRKDFDPEPRIDSAIIKLVASNRQATRKQYVSYYRTVKVLFAQPRKTILNNLAEAKVREVLDKRGNVRKEIEGGLQKIGIDPKDRPQNLNADDMVKISLLIKD